MSTVMTAPPGATAKAAEKSVPRLENGDRLHAREFLRRFENMPGVKKAELLNEIVYMASPVSARHSEPDAIVQALFGQYCIKHPEAVAHTNTTLLLDGGNAIQPDALLRRKIGEGGITHLSDSGYLIAPTELVAEVAASSVSIDAGEKQVACRRAGVEEYFLWRVDEAEIELWTLRAGMYVIIAPDQDGIIESRVFPGLRFDVAAMLRSDLAVAAAAIR